MPLQQRELTPKNIITDILRIVGSSGLSNKVMLEVGALFGCKQNAMRVATSRLTSSATIEKIQHIDANKKVISHYRLSAATDPLTLFIEEWRLGKKRCKPWKPGHWLLCHLSKNPNRTERAQSLRALSLLGFRQGPDKLWIRPDNLKKTFTRIDQQLQQFGLEANATLMTVSQLQEGINEQWQTLWANTENGESYRQHYVKITDHLISSQAMLKSLAPVDAMTESFRLGGNVIDLLIKDPLLPEQIENPEAHESLCRAMGEYDNIARVIWQKRINAIVRSA